MHFYFFLWILAATLVGIIEFIVIWKIPNLISSPGKHGIHLHVFITIWTLSNKWPFPPNSELLAHSQEQLTTRPQGGLCVCTAHRIQLWTNGTLLEMSRASPTSVPANKDEFLKAQPPISFLIPTRQHSSGSHFSVSQLGEQSRIVFLLSGPLSLHVCCPILGNSGFVLCLLSVTSSQQW